MAKLFVKFESNNRGNIEVGTFKIPYDTFREACLLVGTHDDEVIESFVDSQPEEYRDLLYNVATKAFYLINPPDYFSELNDKGGVIVDCEGIWFSVGTTTQITKDLFTNYLSHLSQFFDDDWDDE
jgi:hypothetical protein